MMKNIMLRSETVSIQARLGYLVPYLRFHERFFRIERKIKIFQKISDMSYETIGVDPLDLNIEPLGE